MFGSGGTLATIVEHHEKDRPPVEEVPEMGTGLLRGHPAFPGLLGDPGGREHLGQDAFLPPEEFLAGEGKLPVVLLHEVRG